MARRGSRNNTPTLPAIGSRLSLTDGELPPPNAPTAPRLPRSMLDRANGSTRTGRRQSDSAVAAAMLPAGILAAAAAGAAVLTSGSGGAGSGAAAIADRRGMRGQPRPRASDNGASRLRQRDGGGAGSEGGAGGSPFMANLAAAGGAGAGTGYPPHRRSDAGTGGGGGLTTMGSAPAPTDSAFLPPIEKGDRPAAGAGGAANGAGAKPMTLAQGGEGAARFRQWEKSEGGGGAGLHGVAEGWAGRAGRAGRVAAGCAVAGGWPSTVMHRKSISRARDGNVWRGGPSSNSIPPLTHPVGLCSPAPGAAERRGQHQRRQ